MKIYMGFLRRLLYRKAMEERFFVLRKDSGGKYYYRLMKNQDKNERREIEKYCRRHHLPLSQSDETRERSSGYRNVFLRNKKGLFGSRIYLCAYCGRPLTSGNLIVDHIIPVQKAAGSGFYRLVMRLRRIRNVNDVRNLTPSCPRCNSRKGTHGGLWVIRGWFGRSWLRIMLKELLLLVSGSWVLYVYYHLLHGLWGG